MRARRTARDEHGAVAVLVGILASTLFLIAALVVQFGFARDVRREAQNTADASALAAANRLYQSGSADLAAAAAEAISYATVNMSVPSGDWTSCVDSGHLLVVSASSQCISFDDATSPTKVRVKVPLRNVDTAIGKAGGVSGLAVGAVARAVLRPGGGGPCGICVIGSGNHNLQNGDSLATGASIYFNGSLSLNPQGSVTSDGGTVTIQGSGPNRGSVSPSPSTGSGVAVDDPMAGLALPPDMTGLAFKSSGNICTGGPGIYNNPSGSNCTLTPGLYVFIGGTLGGNAGIVANNVTMYFTCRTGNTPRACNPGESGANLDLSGNGNFTIAAPATSINKSIPKVAIAFDRNNNNTVRLVGNGTMHITGSIYLKSGTLDMRGNGCTSSTSIDSLIIVDDLAFSGANACLDVDYTQNNNYSVPPGDPALDQ